MFFQKIKGKGDFFEKMNLNLNNCVFLFTEHRCEVAKVGSPPNTYKKT